MEHERDEMGHDEGQELGDEERQPYEAPLIESGVAFERVLLLSGCNSGFFCPVPC